MTNDNRGNDDIVVVARVGRLFAVARPPTALWDYIRATRSFGINNSQRNSAHPEVRRERRTPLQFALFLITLAVASSSRRPFCCPSGRTVSVFMCGSLRGRSFDTGA
jgi:hypothetical protein